MHSYKILGSSRLFSLDWDGLQGFDHVDHRCKAASRFGGVEMTGGGLR